MHWLFNYVQTSETIYSDDLKLLSSPDIFLVADNTIVCSLPTIHLQKINLFPVIVTGECIE